MSEIEHPKPGIDWETRAYWEGAKRHELILQRCSSCAAIQHRPRALCVSCFADTIEYFRASGRGSVYSYTITHQNQSPGFRNATPYVLAWVELEEGVRLLSNIVGCSPDKVRIGMPIEVDFADIDGEVAIPRFRPR